MASGKGRQTPSQTIGPFFAYGLTPAQYGYDFSSIVANDLAGASPEGERIRLTGRVLDGDGEPVEDALLEIWQADAQGRYRRRSAVDADPAFTGFGRCGTGTDPEARFVFDTVKPGRIGDGQAPHVNLILTMRGLLNHLFTRLYFEDEAEANAADPVLISLSDDHRQTLIARREVADGITTYHINIHMQGPKETVFFDV